MATFGRYEILERLATGGMAEVYRARAWSAGGVSTDVVIKKILSGYSSDPEFRSLFIHEARISVGLTHPRITQVLDFGLMDGSYFIAMELVDGPDLGDLLVALRKEFALMPLPVAVHVIAEVLEGLDYAHRRTGADGQPLAIVHRDISPNNVLVSRAGEVKLTDFGIARAAGSPAVTRVGRVRGKPQYMSPEQIRGQPLDGRSDLFSCGLLFYEILTGFPAYVGSDDGILMNAILRGELEPPSGRVKDVPRALDAVVARALHLDQDQRFATASELRRTLLDVAQSQRIRPDAEALAALVRRHFGRSRETTAGVEPSLVDLTGEDGELGRFSTSTSSLPLPTTDTAESTRGRVAGTATAESERGPAASPSATQSGNVDPSRPPEATVASAPPPEATSVLPMRAGVLPRSARAAPPAVGRGLGALAFGLAVVAVGYLVVPLMGPPREAARRVDTAPSVTPALAAAETSLATPAPAMDVETLPTLTPPRPSPTAVRTVTAASTPRAVAKPGTLSVNSRPWGDVTIDGRAVGPTPLLDHALAPGTYSIVVTNAAAGVSERFTVTVESGRAVRRSVELR